MFSQNHLFRDVVHHNRRTVDVPHKTLTMCTISTMNKFYVYCMAIIFLLISLWLLWGGCCTVVQWLRQLFRRQAPRNKRADKKHVFGPQSPRTRPRINVKVVSPPSPWMTVKVVSLPPQPPQTEQQQQQQQAEQQQQQQRGQTRPRRTNLLAERVMGDTAVAKTSFTAEWEIGGNRRRHLERISLISPSRTLVIRPMAAAPPARAGSTTTTSQMPPITSQTPTITTPTTTTSTTEPTMSPATNTPGDQTGVPGSKPTGN